MDQRDAAAREQGKAGVLDRVRPVLLVLLVVTIPIAGRIAVPVLSHHKKPVTLALFDVLIWISLAFVCLARLRRAGVKGVLEGLREVPWAAWLLCALTVWSGLIWPRLPGGRPGSFTGTARALLVLVEYAVLAFVVAGELVRSSGERRLALRAAAAASAVAMLWGLVHYFSAADPFYVGSFFGERAGDGSFVPNRNAFGSFLAISVPLFGVLAISAREWPDRCLFGAVAVIGTLLAATGGAVLGIACGLLAGAALVGRRQLAIGVGCLFILLAVGQLLPGHNLRAAAESVRVERKCPRTGQRLLAKRYLRAGADLNVLRAPFRENEPERALLFGVGPGAYTAGTKRFAPVLDARGAGETDKLENFDVLADEPGSFNLFGLAAAELGSLGLLGFIWLFAGLAGRCLSAWRNAGSLDGGNAGSGVAAAAALAALVGALFVSPFASVWIRGSGPMLMVVVAICAPLCVTRAITTDRGNTGEHGAD